MTLFISFYMATFFQFHPTFCVLIDAFLPPKKLFLPQASVSSDDPRLFDFFDHFYSYVLACEDVILSSGFLGAWP